MEDMPCVVHSSSELFYHHHQLSEYQRSARVQETDFGQDLDKDGDHIIFFSLHHYITTTPSVHLSCIHFSLFGYFKILQGGNGILHLKTRLFDMAFSPIDTSMPDGLLMLRNCFFDFAVEHWFGCFSTEPGFARDIGAIEI